MVKKFFPLLFTDSTKIGLELISTTTPAITNTMPKASTTLKYSAESTSDENNAKKKDSKSDPTLVGALVGSFALVLCLIAIAFVWYVWQKKSKRTYNVQERQAQLENSLTLPHSTTHETENIPMSNYL